MARGTLFARGLAPTGDILMILDADITVPPEDLPRFYDQIARDEAEFVNGVRLVYPMEDEAMRFLNLIGNKFFSIALASGSAAKGHFVRNQSYLQIQL